MKIAAPKTKWEASVAVQHAWFPVTWLTLLCKERRTLAVAAAITSFMRDGRAFPSRSAIAQRAGIDDVAAVTRSIHRICELGLMNIERREGRSTVFTMAQPHVAVTTPSQDDPGSWETPTPSRDDIGTPSRGDHPERNRERKLERNAAAQQQGNKREESVEERKAIEFCCHHGLYESQARKYVYADLSIVQDWMAVDFKRDFPFIDAPGRFLHERLKNSERPKRPFWWEETAPVSWQQRASANGRQLLERCRSLLAESEDDLDSWCDAHVESANSITTTRGLDNAIALIENAFKVNEIIDLNGLAKGVAA